MPVIQDLAGHASIIMTRRYTHPADERKQQAVEALLGSPKGLEPATEPATETLKSNRRTNSGSNKREQVNKLDGRPVRARTADLHRVKVAL
jgi:hypothetical protein